MNKCDIIIPIYNAYECVKECIDSILKNTNFKTGDKLVLINDKSSDKKILSMLKKYEKANNFIVVLNNNKNLGFVGTVNKGMKYSNSDVLLLNSDTVVSKNWMDNIKKCAYSDKSIATVSPLSNNATTNSIPIGLQKNEIPSNMTFDEYANLVESCSYTDYPELPTGHGFCLYIKRKILNEIGYFDEKAFGKGYGEENDFCFRALDYGYKNVICDNVIVQHKESQSFSSKKQELVKEHLKILDNRYPRSMQKCHAWCSNFPINYICKNIFYNINMYKRKNILILIHDYNNIKENLGGTSLHVYDLVNNLRKYYNFHILTPENGLYKLYSYFETQESNMSFDSVNSYSVFNFYNEDYKKILEKIVNAFGIELIHVHHLLGHYFDINDISIEKKIPLLFTGHDFYSICPSINLLKNNDYYCECGNEKMCLECLKFRYNLNNYNLDRWRFEWKNLFSNCKTIITPSNSTKTILNNIYDLNNIKAISHGIDIEKNIKNNSQVITKNVAFIGVMAKHKGAEIVSKIIKTNKNANFYLFGNSDYEVLKKSTTNYKYMGVYNRNNIKDLLIENNISLICLFSIWPETFSYTFEETIATGIPVLSFDIGAVCDRINDYKLGWTIKLGSDIKSINDKINEILKDDIGYNKVIENINNYKIKTINEMANEYKELYGKNILKRDYCKDVLRDIIKNNFNVKENIDSIQLRWILNSRKWRLVSKIKVPNIVKKIIK